MGGQMPCKGKYRDWLTEEGLLKVEGWARDGLTDKQIAQKIGITPNTFYQWVNRFTDFKYTLKKSKEVADRKVENALFKRALGYEYEEETKMISEGGKKSIKVIKKHVPPDTTAIIFWLKNRKREQWRDVNKIEIDKPVQVEQNTNIDLSKLSKDEILRMTKEAFKDE